MPRQPLDVANELTLLLQKSSGLAAPKPIRAPNSPSNTMHTPTVADYNRKPQAYLHQQKATSAKLHDKNLHLKLHLDQLSNLL